MTTKKTDKGSDIVTMAEIGALAVGAAGAAAAGYYFYASKDAKQNRKVVRKWASEFKTEVVKKARAMKDIDQKALVAIIADAASKYEQVRSIDKKDLARAARELKTNWRAIVGEIQKNVQGAKKTATVATKKTVKNIEKTATKVAKKVAKKVGK